MRSAIEISLVRFGRGEFRLTHIQERGQFATLRLIAEQPYGAFHTQMMQIADVRSDEDRKYLEALTRQKAEGTAS